jgi:hypothetical protein
MICVRFAVAFLVLLGTAAAEPPVVDLALVLSVDASRSVSNSRYDLQRRGFAAAFENDAVINAIASGERQAIAVTLVEWSGLDEQTQVVDWTILFDRASARAFAAAILESPRTYEGFTSISGAIEFSAALFSGLHADAQRKVIDVSGDGRNNAGRSSALARDEAVAKGITINGLAITAVDPDLERHYLDEVVGGPGSFLTAALNFEAFPHAILSKLVREIATAPDSGSIARVLVFASEGGANSPSIENAARGRACVDIDALLIPARRTELAIIINPWRGLVLNQPRHDVSSGSRPEEPSAVNKVCSKAVSRSAAKLEMTDCPRAFAALRRQSSLASALRRRTGR